MTDDISKVILERIKKDISETRMLSHKSGYFDFPDDLVGKVYAAIDWDDVIKECIDNIQNRICDTIVQSMVTEIKTDTKKILGVQGVREKLRMEAYPAIMRALNQGEK